MGVQEIHHKCYKPGMSVDTVLIPKSVKSTCNGAEFLIRKNSCFPDWLRFRDYFHNRSSCHTFEKASAQLLLRAFDMEEIEREKTILNENARAVEKKYGGKVELSFRRQYLNMKDTLDKHPDVVARLEKAYKAAGVEIIRKPIRGGTDGSRLTEMGIPTPNIFTGGHEFHSRNEWVSLNSMSKAADVLINLLSGDI